MSDKTDKTEESTESKSLKEEVASTVSETAAQTKKIATSTKVVIAVSLVIIAALVAVIILQGRKSEPTNDLERPLESRGILVDESNVEEVIQELETYQRTPDGRYRVNMNTTWHFTDGGSVSYDAYVGNNKANTYAVYFDVVIKETDEIICSSPIIPVGKSTSEIKLDKELEAGTYDCVLTYHLVDENQQNVSKLNMALTIIVEN